MEKNYIEKNVDAILTDTSLPFPLNIAMASAWIIGNHKGTNLKLLDVKKESSLADYFVITSTNNSMQAKAIADSIATQLKRHHYNIISKEGVENTDWILLDIGDILVHIFQQEARSHYDLDSLWHKAEKISIPESYYFPNDEVKSPVSESERNYF